MPSSGKDAYSAVLSSRRAGAGTVAVISVLGALLAAGAAVIALTGGMPGAGWLAARNALMVGAPIAVGLYAWHEATHARFGRLLVLAGATWSLVALSATTDAVPYSVGRVAGWAAEIGIVYLTLAFPSGRLPGRPDRALVLGTLALIGLLYVPTVLLVDHFPEPAYYISCSTDCPANALALLDATPAWVTDAVIPLREGLSIVLMLLIGLRLAYRIRHATGLMRRALTPVLAVALVHVVTLAVSILLRRTGLVDGESAAWLHSTLALSLPLLSAGFLAGLLSLRLYAADALLVLAQRLRAAPSAEQRRAAIAQAVMDPSLELAYARPDGDGWVTPAGWAVSLPYDDPDRSVTVIVDRGGPVAALIHDRTLDEQRAFLQAVGTYALVWDENARLAERVDSSRGELRASHARILAAADDERRRIERDLHDGGQQRLVALRIRLQLAEEMMAESPAGAREMLQRLARDVDGVLDELRSLAAGVYPAMLAGHGLPDAVRAASMQSLLPVHVIVQGATRYPEDVETAAYFCCVEALQNVAKHATGATAAWVSLQLDGDLCFEVRDDGPGFDTRATGRRGLLNLHDRVTALGGELTISSSPGDGTRVGGRLPAGARVRAPEAAEGRRPEFLLADEHRGA